MFETMDCKHQLSCTESHLDCASVCCSCPADSRSTIKATVKHERREFSIV
ncbi:hypothetical protein HanIR_Chr11g0506741 [Helianthus annuus]|nr:hypothetical protein HanIR_Chr11g0506741 [Helianthus annuus]